MTVPGQDPANPGGETPPNPPASEPAASTAGQAPAGETFDAARAQRTIDALRNEIRDLKPQAQAGKTAQQRLQELEDAGKSELEKATAKTAELQAQLTAAQAAYQSALISAAVMAEATAQGANPEAIKRGTIARLVDTSAIELADSGEVKGADKAVKALLEAEPYLKAGTTTTTGVPPTPRQNGVPSDAEGEQARQTQGAWLRGRI